MQLPVYLDNNATTPCDPRVVQAMLPYFNSFFGNAASKDHLYGWQAKEAVDIARQQIAALIHCDPVEIIFTSGATEGVNLAIKGVAETYRQKGNHIITVVTEHKAVLDTCRHLEKQGYEITYLPVNELGQISLNELEAAIKPSTILIAVMYANNETGVIAPVNEISTIAKQHGIIFFSDATQAVGKIRVDVINNGIDLMTFSAHKMYGPKGIGAVYVRRKDPRVKLTAQIDGGGHERGLRSGTLNVPAIVGFGEACLLCKIEIERDKERLLLLRDQLQASLLTIPFTLVNGDVSHRLPHTLNMAFSSPDAAAIIASLQSELAVSSASACSSATIEPSFVLKAMGLNDEMAYSSIRFGLGRFTSEEEINHIIVRIKETVGQLRSLQLVTP